MNTPYVSDKPFTNNYYVASVGEAVVRESMFFSTLQQAIAFKQDVEKAFKNETFIVVDTNIEGE